MKESPILSFLGLSLLAFALAAPLQAKDADGNELMHDLAKKVFAEWKNKIEVDPKLLKKAERERAKAERKAEKEKKKK